MSSSERIIVVTGGAGYIGSSVCVALKRRGYSPVILDNFSTSRRPTASLAYPCIEVDLSDWQATQRAWRQLGQVHAVIHFAARALVPESCEQPEMYFRNNFLATLNSAHCAVEGKAQLFVHSSSCAVYGVPKIVPIAEGTPFDPSSPYGESKAVSEQVLKQLSRYRKLRVLNLRYFNPAGAMDGGLAGESHDPETHLVPNVVKAAFLGKPFIIYGDDYPTPDGTCIRDFIHIEDLVEAHIKALEALERAPLPVQAINLGTKRGTSVREVIAAAERVFGKKLTVKVAPRRPGDPPVLVADNELARSTLDWRPQRFIDDMLLSHYQWSSVHK